MISNKFNEYFSTVASNLQDKIFNPGIGFEKYLKNMNEHTFFISPTNKVEIIQIINTLKHGKASGSKSFPGDILHLMKLELSSPLAEIDNLSFETGIYIDKLKIWEVIQNYKDKGSNLECSNYRPISVIKFKQNFRKTYAF